MPSFSLVRSVTRKIRRNKTLSIQPSVFSVESLHVPYDFYFEQILEILSNVDNSHHYIAVHSKKNAFSIKHMICLFAVEVKRHNSIIGSKQTT